MWFFNNGVIVPSWRSWRLRCSYRVNDVSIGIFNRLYLIETIQPLNGQFEQKKNHEKECVDNWPAPLHKSSIADVELSMWFKPPKKVAKIRDSIVHSAEKKRRRESRRKKDLARKWWRNSAKKRPARTQQKRNGLIKNMHKLGLWPEYWSAKEQGFFGFSLDVIWSVSTLLYIGAVGVTEWSLSQSRKIGY